MQGKKPEHVNSRLDLVEFIRELNEDLKDHPESWENIDLSAFLEALAAWVEDMEGYFEGRGKPIPSEASWSLIAQMLAAASIYE